MFSIIIPTFNRAEVLELTLEAYFHQTCPELIREIIIIDDGSTDDTRSRIRRISERSPIKLIYLFQQNKGPAEARNRGIHIASADILLITGDDIVPHPDMIKEHFIGHESHEFNTNICVLGYTAWPKDMKVTPFMRYIQEMGLQFGYSVIPDASNVPFNFFYTSNVSLHRTFLLEDELFDTDFPYAAWEDIELAYRLTNRGLKIIYNSRALGYHYHSISYISFRKRQEKCGYSAYIFYRKHPELKDFLGIDASRTQSPLSKAIIDMMDKFCFFADRCSIESPPAFYDKAMSKYYNEGIIKARRKYNEALKERKPD